MERYFSVTKSRTTASANPNKTTGSSLATRSTKHFNTRLKPYVTKKEERNPKSLLTHLPDDVTPSSTVITKLLLKTLNDELNPITHSDIGLRSDHVVSMAGGHQHAEERRHRGYHEERNRKLAEQAEIATKSTSDTERKVLRGVRVFINGYLAGTTDIEMKRIVTEAGGSTLAAASGATHILTSQPLSGSKTHKLLTKKFKSIVHVVKPEWVFDSIKAGRRRPEREYGVIKDSTTQKLSEMWKE
ncbi:hypothetical protein E1B28_004201 [Marasmius oreades]|uniref:BRCT domain-containing protein n=1 Tax=Marasmius oreades TaxID=181124 RepID=A0A9P8AC89_9AGAR|nr:uncharacterized protein E1B28_004201 [Marasmius oreades]KAG7096791.1 hypothetical protein E1B28_004201 [Marasmius oreades]